MASKYAYRSRSDPGVAFAMRSETSWAPAGTVTSKTAFPGLAPDGSGSPVVDGPICWPALTSGAARPQPKALSVPA